jgi:hypothetical protein
LDVGETTGEAEGLFATEEDEDVRATSFAVEGGLVVKEFTPIVEATTDGSKEKLKEDTGVL